MQAKQLSLFEHKQAPRNRGRVINVDKTFIHQFVDRKMAEGKASSLCGWTMETILADVELQYGSQYVSIARNYIIHDVCGMSGRA